MKQIETTSNISITDKDFQDFLSATGEEQWKILLAHAERNREVNLKRKSKANQQTDLKRND